MGMYLTVNEIAISVSIMHLSEKFGGGGGQCIIRASPTEKKNHAKVYKHVEFVYKQKTDLLTKKKTLLNFFRLFDEREGGGERKFIFNYSIK